MPTKGKRKRKSHQRPQRRPSSPTGLRPEQGPLLQSLLVEPVEKEPYDTTRDDQRLDRDAKMEPSKSPTTNNDTLNNKNKRGESTHPETRIVVAGGGIGGLAFAALLAEQAPNFKITVLEQQAEVFKKTPGGGIGLWKNSIGVMEALRLLDKLHAVSAYMPFPRYLDASGKILARGSEEFGEFFPVSCLSRDDLLRILYEKCVSLPNVTIMTRARTVGYAREAQHPQLLRVDFLQPVAANNFTSEPPPDLRSLYCDVLVGGDGIHSLVRAQMMREMKIPARVEPHPEYVGYTYYRANVALNEEQQARFDWFSSSFETWGMSSSSSSRGRRFPIRFGYVPLKKPYIFWFISFPTSEKEGASVPRLPTPNAVRVDDVATRDWLVSLVSGWKRPANEKAGKDYVDYAEMVAASTEIVRTDIYKIPRVTNFPWATPDGRVVLLGDSAHATAPNIAQGAGLSIEDAATLALSLSRCVQNGSMAKHGVLGGGVKEYEEARKPRAWTVQLVADVIAWVGSFQYRPVIWLRNLFMRTATTLLPGLQRLIFEWAVSYSLGGDSRVDRVWELPDLATPAEGTSGFISNLSILGKALGERDFRRLERHVREFKASAAGGSGSGTVSVELGTNPLSRMVAKIAGLPCAMRSEPFIARVEPVSVSPPVQRWTRVFAVRKRAQTTYSTTHSIHVGRRETYLLEGVGGMFDSIVKFAYRVKAVAPTSSSSTSAPLALSFESVGLRVFGVWIPLPSFLLLSSRWTETPTLEGWTFDGEIRAPLIGRLMRYYGEFRAEKYYRPRLGNVSSSGKNQTTTATKGRVVVLGGTGLLGRNLSRALLLEGFEDVVVLSRFHAQRFALAHRGEVKVMSWDGTSPGPLSALLDQDTIVVNLAGENPGAGRWSEGLKHRILSSRLTMIETLAKAIKLAEAERGVRPKAVFQASAVGLVGDVAIRDLELSDQHSYKDLAAVTQGQGKGSRFRSQCCFEIERTLHEVIGKGCDVPAYVLRIGHVLSMEWGGLLPYMNFASLARVARFGDGKQYVPWIHMEDFVGATVFLARRVDKLNAEWKSGLGEFPAFNLVAPNPVPNAEFMRALAEARNRWACWIPIPAWSLRVALGESACVLLDNERMVPARLRQLGYAFRYGSVKEALFSFV